MRWTLPLTQIALVLALALPAVTSSQEPSAQSGETSAAAVDASEEARITKAWEDAKHFWEQPEKGDATDADDPQRRYAPEFFEYWINHKDTRSGRMSIQTAFTMWGNLGDVAAVQQAAGRIDIDSPVWKSVIWGIGSAYSRQDRNDELVKWLEQLAPRLVDKPSQSTAYRLLGDVLRQKGDEKRARDSYERVLDLGVRVFDIKSAKSAIHEIDSLRIGQAVADFTAKDMDGEIVRLSALRGKVVLLDFWATWCGPCVQEIAPLQQIYESADPSQLVIVQVSRDHEIEPLKRFISDRKLLWPQVWDGSEGELTWQFNATAIPRVFLIDREGHLIAKDLRGEKLKSAVASLIASSSH